MLYNISLISKMIIKQLHSKKTNRDEGGTQSQRWRPTTKSRISVMFFYRRLLLYYSVYSRYTT